MRESFHVLIRQAAELIYLDPWPRANVCDGIFALALACKVLAGLPSVFAGELDLEYSKYTEGLVLESFDSI